MRVHLIRASTSGGRGNFTEIKFNQIRGRLGTFGDFFAKILRFEGFSRFSLSCRRRYSSALHLIGLVGARFLFFSTSSFLCFENWDQEVALPGPVVFLPSSLGNQQKRKRIASDKLTFAKLVRSFVRSFVRSVVSTLTCRFTFIYRFFGPLKGLPLNAFEN